MIIAYEENGISKQREATTEEVAYIESAQAEAQAAKLIEQNEKENKVNARNILLDRLGITAEEAQLILGGSN